MAFCSKFVAAPTGALPCRRANFASAARLKPLLFPGRFNASSSRATLSIRANAAAAVNSEPKVKVKKDPDADTNLSDVRKILGQAGMKGGLLLTLLHPDLGGVFLLGERGTGKSTLVRAIRSLLPPRLWRERDDDRRQIVSANGETGPISRSFEVHQGKRPFVNCPLGATEDRVCGSLNLERALRGEAKAFEEGLLAQANGGLLYVDEVNLLDDHIVDLLLDAAASGWNNVEREGLSVTHRARFALIGSANPEEGDLRPQLLDRFGMNVKVVTPRSPRLRTRIVEEQRSKMAPEDGSDSMSDAEKHAINARADALGFQDQFNRAQQRLKHIKVSPGLKYKIAALCSELGIEGLRGDLVITRAATALAAFQQQNEVTPEIIATVAPMCLRHRLRKDPSQRITDSDEKLFEALKAQELVS